MTLKSLSQSTLLMTFPKLFIILVFILVPEITKAEIRIQDDLGRNVILKHPAQRIISLYGAYSEILYSMNMQHLLVARTNAETIPEEVLQLPSIGTHMRPNLELIVGMAPDLVLQLGGREESIQSVYDLEKLGITVAYFKVSTFDDLFRVTEQLGLFIGQERAAGDLVRKMRERLKTVAAAIAMIDDRPSVFYEVRSPQLLTVGDHSMVADIIKMAGGINCIKGDRKLIRVNEEELFRLSPSFYFYQTGPMNPSPIPLPERPRLRYLNAVINGNWAQVDEKMFSRPGPRNIDAVEMMARVLHPVAFSHE